MKGRFTINDIIPGLDVREIDSPLNEPNIKIEAYPYEGDKDIDPYQVKETDLKNEETGSFKGKLFAYLIPENNTKTLFMMKERAVIGRQGDCDMIIEVKDRECSAVSRHHAILSHESGKFYLEDISSAGTYMAKKEGKTTSVIRLGGRGNISKAEIKDGQVIRFATEIYAFKIHK